MITRASIGAAFSEKAPDKLFHEGSGQEYERIDLAERRKKLLEKKKQQEGGES